MFTNKNRPTLQRRLLIAVNLTLLVVLGLFIVWDYNATWTSLIENKRVGLQEEAKILLKSIPRLKKAADKSVVQSYIDEVCGAMQETTSPGHHIVVKMDDSVIQAKAHHRASPEIFSAMQKATGNKNGVAPLGKETLVAGVARQNNTTIYVSEYLSNLREIVKMQLFRRIISIFVVGIILAVVLNIVLNSLISKPLDTMVGIVHQFSQGLFQVRMPGLTTKELGTLADEFNHMASQIETAEKERTSRLEKARAIQQNLLPNASYLKDINATCLFRPAAEVGGDYFDIIRLDDDSLLFCVADVIGHDVPAAMSAAMLKALLKDAAAQGYKLSKLIRRIHKAFSEVILEGDFATMILARWFTHKQQLYYVSAGHEAGYLAKANGSIKELSPTGPILGLAGLSEWSEQQLRIESGDRLILLTDGIAETLSPNGEAFGRSRLAEVINKFRKESIEIFSEELMKAVVEFRGTEMQLDDITMLSVDL